MSRAITDFIMRWNMMIDEKLNLEKIAAERTVSGKIMEDVFGDSLKLVCKCLFYYYEYICFIL